MTDAIGIVVAVWIIFVVGTAIILGVVEVTDWALDIWRGWGIK